MRHVLPVVVLSTLSKNTQRSSKPVSIKNPIYFLQIRCLPVNRKYNTPFIVSFTQLMNSAIENKSGSIDRSSFIASNKRLNMHADDHLNHPHLQAALRLPASVE